MKNFLFSAIIFALSTIFALAVGEVVVRTKNSSMQNYDIEMWRYAKELKKRSDDPVLGHEHIASSSAVLQSVEIRINEWGLRGEPVAPPLPGKRRILFLGSSVTFGWGVREEDTVTERLKAMFHADGQDVEVLNAGIGNYNARRYVERFLTRLQDLKPTDIVVDFFLRDAEVLDAGGGNILLRNSELAVMTWVATTRYFGKASEETLEQHYRNVYKPEMPGFQDMLAALKKLGEYAREHNIRLYLAMTPDVHDLVDYKFEFVHSIMRKVAQDYGYTYIDLLPSMRNLTPQELWALPGDPHPNKRGHELMARAIFPSLEPGGRPGAKTAASK